MIKFTSISGLWESKIIKHCLDSEIAPQCFERFETLCGNTTHQKSFSPDQPSLCKLTDLAFSKKLLSWSWARQNKVLKPNFLDFNSSLITLLLRLGIPQRRILLRCSGFHKWSNWGRVETSPYRLEMSFFCALLYRTILNGKFFFVLTNLCLREFRQCFWNWQLWFLPHQVNNTGWRFWAICLKKF